MREAIRTQIRDFYAFKPTLSHTVIYAKTRNNSAFSCLRKSLFDHAEKPVRHDGTGSFIARNSLFRSAVRSLAPLFPTLAHRREKPHCDAITCVSSANTYIYHDKTHISQRITAI